MLATLIAFVAAASALWVYWDATRLRIGRIKGRKGLSNMSAEAWALVTLLLWIVGFPAYLLKRNTLRAQAEEHPVESRRKPVWFAVFGALGVAFIWNAYSSQPGSQVPDCGATATKGLVKDILARNLQQSGVGGEPTIHVNAPRTTDSDFGTYRCKAFVDIFLPDGRTLSGRAIRYTSTASDAGRHIVEIQEQP